jgi:replicative DNA helicase
VTPVHDQNAELAVLACCLMSRVARDEAKKHLTGGDFYSPANETIWDAMASLDRRGEGVDPSTLMTALTGKPEAAVLPTLLTYPTVADNVAEHARAVRGWATRRRLLAEAKHVEQAALNTTVSADSIAATVATRFASLRNSGITEDVQSITLDELLTKEDDEPDWVIPGLLERRDRLMLTGEEGLGKSYLLRQIAIMAAAGLDPFEPGKRIPPVRVSIIDCENSTSQIRRKVRPVVGFARRWGKDDGGHPVNLLCSPRIDITRDRDLARIHYELDASQPDLLIIGPLYRLVPRALQTDDEAAPVLAALDTIRERGVTLLIEAHAGHSIGKGGHRDLRPRGSSALLGWPEFGYGMRTVASGYADLIPWRGDRDERDWPGRIAHDRDHIRWVPVESAPAQDEWSPTRGIA